jgi:histidinol-phosphate aminotransferase
MSSPRYAVLALAPAVHGARDYAELKHLNLSPDEVIDFSANSNPYGPHPAVLQAVSEAVSAAALARYPDRDCLALRAAIAAADHVPVENILPGNGATELIHLIALAFASSNRRSLVLCPTFGEYARAAQLLGGSIYNHHPQTYANLRLYPDDVVAIIRRVQPDIIWLCNPNNPTGQVWTPDELAHLYTADPDRRILWVIDESYRHFVDPDSGTDFIALSEWPSNLIRLRSLTKDYSLAGLRLGYAIATPEIIRALSLAQPSWSVNSLAQAAGVAALQPEVITWRQQTLTQLRHHAAALWADLVNLGLTVLPTATTFALVTVGNAAAFRRYMLEHGLLVRDCTSFGMPGHVRIASLRPEENRRLTETLRALNFC